MNKDKCKAKQVRTGNETTKRVIWYGGLYSHNLYGKNRGGISYLSLFQYKLEGLF